MTAIYNHYSIKDLENLSGIKAHTIRIWEKRYGLLEPERTETNIRLYNNANLQKLLNIVALTENGFKISKIGEMSTEEIKIAVRETLLNTSNENVFMQSFLIAMLNFDQRLFEETYNKLLHQFAFRKVFVDFFLPLLHRIGLEWQSDKITPAHEHFISSLIQQKLLLNIEKLQYAYKNDDLTYVLFLPSNEIHELGLLYIHYELKLLGKHSIYLGPNVPIENIKELSDIYKNIQFISYFVVQPNKDEVIDYLKNFNTRYLHETNKLWVLGRNTENITLPKSLGNVTIFKNIPELQNYLK